MLVAQVSRTFSAKSAARIPMIKFRKGGGMAQKSGSPAPAGGGKAPQASSGSGGHVYEMSNMPLRFRRQPISQEECNIINGGGIA